MYLSGINASHSQFNSKQYFYIRNQQGGAWQEVLRVGYCNICFTTLLKSDGQTQAQYESMKLKKKKKRKISFFFSRFV